MKKQYKIQLPKGKKVTMTNVDFEDGVMTVNVELENRKVQKYEPKDGDILYGDSLTRNIIIYKGTNERGAVLSYAGLASFSGINRLAICDETNLGFGYASEYTRYATDEEKQLLFDALAKEGKRWNPETKQIDDVRWRAGKGNPYYYIIGFDRIVGTTDERLACDENRYATNNYFKTRESVEKVAEQIREIFKNSKAE